MDRTTALRRLAALEPALRARGVQACALFGSTARNEAGPDSDVDVLIDLPASHGLSLLDLMAVRSLISDEIGRPADLVVRANLKPLLRDAIQAEAVPVF